MRAAFTLQDEEILCRAAEAEGRVHGALAPHVLS